MRGFNYKKSIQALNIIAQANGGCVNKMKAIKLIWLADRLHLRQYGRMITEDNYFALPLGPVPSATRDVLEDNPFLNDLELNYGRDFIVSNDKYHYSSVKTPDLMVFSQTDIDVLNLIISKYNHLDHYQLSELSHSFPEWSKFKSALDKKIASRFDINPEDFFADYEDGTGTFIEEKENLELSHKLFQENLKLLSLVQ